MVINRRDFFFGTWLQGALSCPNREENKAAENQPESSDNYFSSLETCYAFLSEVPLEDLHNEAIKRGVPYEGLSKFELAKSLFSAGEYRR